MSASPFSCWLATMVWSAAVVAQTVTPPTALDQRITLSRDGVSIPATVTLPTQVQTNKRLVVFVPEASLHDRNRSVPANQLSEALAHALAEHGIASLRYARPLSAPAATDGQNRLWPGTEVIGDAAAALQYGNGVLAVSPAGEFLLVAGLSATLAPYIADKYPNLGGIILLAPAVLPVEQILAQQKRRDLETQGKREAEIRQELASQNQIFADIRAGKIPPNRLINGAPARIWLEWMNRNPAEQLRKLNVPVLVLQGAHDEQVSEENYEKLQKTLGGKGPLAEFHWFPNLNHQFVGSASGAGLSQIPHIDSQVTVTIIAWLDHHRAASRSNTPRQ